MCEARIGVLTVSDRVSRGDYEDRGGPAVTDYLAAALESSYEVLARVVPDEQPAIEAALRQLSQDACGLIVTTGGTGPTPRDVTPEAVEAVCSKTLPGFGEQMRRHSAAAVPTAILSRQTAGVLNESLVLALPGNPKAVAECLDAVFMAVPHAVKLLSRQILRPAKPTSSPPCT